MPRSCWPRSRQRRRRRRRRRRPKRHAELHRVPCQLARKQKGDACSRQAGGQDFPHDPRRQPRGEAPRRPQRTTTSEAHRRCRRRQLWLLLSSQEVCPPLGGARARRHRGRVQHEQAVLVWTSPRRRPRSTSNRNWAAATSHNGRERPGMLRDAIFPRQRSRLWTRLRLILQHCLLCGSRNVLSRGWSARPLLQRCKHECLAEKMHLAFTSIF